MVRTLALIAAVALSATAYGAQAAAPCRDAKGKFIKCSVAAAPATGAYKLDAKGNCHDAKGKMAKKTMCAAK